MLPNIHILGIQGSGKGTQSALLEQRFGLTYLASGDLFRTRATLPDALGRELSVELKKGKLVADRLLFEAVEDFLGHTIISVGLLGDGVIRTIQQLESLNSIWDNFQLDPVLLINLKVEEAEAHRRIQKRRVEQNNPQLQKHHLKYSGKLLKRTDDNPRAIQERFQLFHKMTEPVVTEMEKTGRCIHIDASKKIEEVQLEILAKLKEYYPELHELN